MQGKPRSILPLLGIGKTNNGDYVTKHHAPIHHQAAWPIFLTPIKILQELRGRVTNRPWVFFLEKRFLIRHGPNPLAYVPTYVRMFHSTPHHRVEWNEYWVAQQKGFHSTCVCTYVQTYFPLHSTSQSGVERKKSMSSYKKPDVEKITRRWKSQMLKILPDAEKARCWKNCQMLKKHQIYSL